jgi:hypothetical protein
MLTLLSDSFYFYFKFIQVYFIQNIITNKLMGRSMIYKIQFHSIIHFNPFYLSKNNPLDSSQNKARTRRDEFIK